MSVTMEDGIKRWMAKRKNARETLKHKGAVHRCQPHQRLVAASP